MLAQDVVALQGMSSRSLAPLLLATLLGPVLAGCASDAGSERPSDAAVETTYDRARIAALRRRATKVVEDAAVLESRLESSLSAVNWALRQYPECTDPLFEELARLDLRQRDVGKNARVLVEELMAAEGGQKKIDLHEVTAIDNRITHLDDEITLINADVAMLFGRLLKRGRPCELPTDETPDGRRIEKL